MIIKNELVSRSFYAIFILVNFYKYVILVFQYNLKFQKYFEIVYIINY